MRNVFPEVPGGHSDRSRDLYLETSVWSLDLVVAKRPFPDALDAVAGVIQVAIGDNDEFVPAPASDDVAGAEVRLEFGRECLQQIVSGQMPVRIVDLFEAVQVQQNDTERNFLSAPLRHRKFNTAAIDQTGEGIDRRLTLRL